MISESQIEANSNTQLKQTQATSIFESSDRVAGIAEQQLVLTMLQ